MKPLKQYLLNYFNKKNSESVKLLAIQTSVFLLFVFLFNLNAIRNLKSEYDVKQFFPAQHKLLTQDQRVVQYFKIEEKSSLVLILQNNSNSSWLQSKNIKLLKNFTETLESNNQIKKVIGLGNLQGTFEAHSNLYVGRLFDQVPENLWTKMLKVHPFAKPNLISKNNLQTLVILELKNNSPEVLIRLQNDISKLVSSKFKSFQINYAGVPLLQKDISDLLKSELSRSVLLGLFVFVLVLLALFEGFSGLVIAVSNVLFVNVIVLGLMSLFNIKLDVLLSTLPVIISLVTISLTVQILCRVVNYPHYKSAFFDIRLFGIVSNLKTHFNEFFLASLMPALGFFMLIISDIGIIKKYGLIISVLILLSWILSQVFLVPALLLLPVVKLRAWASKPAFWALSIFQFKTAVLGFTVLMSVIGLVGFSFLNWNTRLFDDLPKNHQARINTEIIDQTFGGTISTSIVLIGNEAIWTDPINMKKLDLLSKDIKKLPSVGTVISAADFLKKTSLKGIRLPASAAETQESLFLFSMAENDPTISFLTPEKTFTRLDLRLKDKPRYEQQADLLNIQSLVQKYFPGLKYNMSGMGITAHQLNTEMSKELIFGFWQSLLLIGLILIFIFKSVRWAFVACLPNLVPPLALIAILSLTQTAIKPSVAIIFSIAIGLAFSNTVYLLGKLKSIMTEKGLADFLPLKSMLISEMMPCLFSSLLVASGFIVFLFSYFEVNKIFGVYMLLSIIAGAFGDLVFLPSLLKRYPQLLLGPTLTDSLNLKNFRLSVLKIFTACVFLQGVDLAKTSAESLDANQILKKSKLAISSQDDSADIVMKIIEKDGSLKERKLHIKRKFGDKHMTLVRMKAPADLKGMGLLNIIDNGEEDQWLYLPSTKQVRRLVGQNKKTGILGSELTAEDLDITTVKGSAATLLKTLKIAGEDFALIEVKSKSNQTQYSKALVLVSLKTYLPSRLEYFNKKNTPVKRVDFKNYQKFGGVYRAQSILVRNLVNKRGTDLFLSNIKSNVGLSEDEFSQRALSRE